MPTRSLRLIRILIRSRSLCILLILILAFLLRMGGLDKSLWIDELVSLKEVYKPASPEIFRRLGTTPYSLFTSNQFIRISDWMMVTGSLRMVRLPMLLTGILAIWLAWKAGRRLGDWPTGLFFAALLAVWPYKAFNDNIIRYYPIMIMGGVATVYVWEIFRRRRTLRSYIIAMVITFLALLTQTISFVLIIFPSVYTLWWFLTEPILAFRRRKWPSRSTWADAACMLVLFIPFCFVQVQFNRTPDFVIGIINQVFAPDPESVPHVTQEARIKFVAGRRSLGRNTDPPPVKSGIPPVSVLVNNTLSTLKTGLNPRKPSLPHLIGLEKEPHLYWNVFPNWKLDQGATPAPWAALAAGWLFLAGLIFLLILSPPLMLSSLAVILFTGILLKINSTSLVGLFARYYVISGTIQLLFFAAGVAFIFWILRKPIHKFFPRFHAGFAPVVASILSLTIFYPYANATLATAKLAYSDYFPFYQNMTRQYPYGIAFLGSEAAYNGFYNDLAILKEGRKPHDWWRSPRRNQVFEIFPEAKDSRFVYRVKNVTALEQFNDVQAIISYRTINYVTYNPFDTSMQRLFAKSYPMNYSWGDARIHELGRNMFLSRGRAAELLSPRLLDSTTASKSTQIVYVMQSRFETPGPYELTVYEPSNLKLTAIRIDDQPIQFTAKPLPALSNEKHARRKSLLHELQLNRPPLLSETMKQNVQPQSHWIKPDSSWEVIDDKTLRASSAKFITPFKPWTDQRMTLEFTGQPSKHSPLIIWRRLEDKWRPLTSNTSAGDLTYDIKDGFVDFNLAVRINSIPKAFTYHRLVLIDPQSKNIVLGGETQWINAVGREMRVGDILNVGTSFHEQTIRQHLGKILTVGIESREVPPNSSEMRPSRFLPAIQSVSPGVGRINFLRFDLDQDKLRVGVGVPKS